MTASANVAKMSQHRGLWGSGGSFSFANLLEDAQAIVD
jgi:hypothetical protein